MPRAGEEREGRRGGEAAAVGDPVLAWFLRSYLAAVPAFFLLMAGSAWRDGTLTAAQFAARAGASLSDVRPFLASYTLISGYAIILLTVPLVKRMLSSADACLAKLWEQGALSPKAKGGRGSAEAERRRSVERLRSDLDDGRGRALALLFALLIAAFNLSIDYDARSWENIKLFPASRALDLASDAFFSYVFAAVVWRMAATVLFIRRLDDEFEVEVQPLHPDRSGGLKPLGDLAFSVGAVLLAVGLWLVVGLFTAPEFLLSYVRAGIVAYTASSIFLFFYPLRDLHHIMRERKAELLGRLGRRISARYGELCDDVLEGGREVDARKLRQLEALEELYAKAESMPEWPFDKETLTKVVSTVGFPMGMALAKLLGGGLA